MDINSIGGGMMGSQMMQMPMQGMQDMNPSQSVQGIDQMKNGPQQMQKPEDMQAQGIPQQDRTEMSDEAQGIGGAQAAAQAGQVGGMQGQQQDMTQQIKETTMQIIEEAKVQGPGQKGQNQGTNAKVEELKQQLNMAKQNGTPVDDTVKQAADKVVEGDIKTAEKILNGQQQGQGAGAAQGLGQEQQVGQMQQMNHPQQIVSSIEQSNHIM